MGALLAINIGNTRAGLGWFKARPREGVPLPDHARSCLISDSNKFAPPDIPNMPVEAVLIASVNPPAEVAIAAWVADCFGLRPLRFPQDVPAPIGNLYQPPDALGADRLADAVAAYIEFGSPSIIVDAGTAVTIDAVGGESPAFLGGSILPGLRLAANALARGTALLPDVDVSDTGSALAASTADAIRAGVVRGLAGAIDRLVADITAQLGKPAPVILTGGDASRLCELCRTQTHLRPHLTLSGLAAAYYGHCR